METPTLSDKLSSQWDGYLGAICTNIRQLRLLINDLSIAAPMVAGEVNKNDLVGITALQRFNPELHQIIYQHPDFFTYPQSWLRNPTYIPEKARKRRDAEAKTAINSLLEKSPISEAYRDLLFDLFPAIREKIDEERRGNIYFDRSSDINVAKHDKRISHPDYFPIYFRYQVPDAIVSTKELGRIVAQIGACQTRNEAIALLDELLTKYPRGTLRRYDLFEKLREVHFPLLQSRLLAEALSHLADRYQYDIMDLGEAALALDLIFNEARRQNTSIGMTELLRCCLTIATDDTFALRILSRLENKDSERFLKATEPDLDIAVIQSAFRTRMIRRYVHAVSPETMALDRIDPQAFWRWVDIGPMERTNVHKFWRSFVSQDERRLASVIQMFFSQFAWSLNPLSRVQAIFTEKYLRHGLATFKKSNDMEETYRQALRWVELYLEGKFSRGVPIMWQDPSVFGSNGETE